MSRVASQPSSSFEAGRAGMCWSLLAVCSSISVAGILGRRSDCHSCNCKKSEGLHMMFSRQPAREFQGWQFRVYKHPLSAGGSTTFAAEFLEAVGSFIPAIAEGMGGCLSCFRGRHRGPIKLGSTGHLSIDFWLGVLSTFVADFGRTFGSPFCHCERLRRIMTWCFQGSHRGGFGRQTG